MAATAGLCEPFAEYVGASVAFIGLDRGEGLLMRLTASAEVKDLLLLEGEPGR